MRWTRLVLGLAVLGQVAHASASFVCRGKTDQGRALEFRMTGSRSGNDLSPDTLQIGKDEFSFDNRPKPSIETLATLPDATRHYWKTANRVSFELSGAFEDEERLRFLVSTKKGKPLIFLRTHQGKGTIDTWTLSGHKNHAAVECKQDG